MPLKLQITFITCLCLLWSLYIGVNEPCAWAAKPDHTNSSAAVSNVAVSKLDTEFQNLYAQARKNQIQKCGPIIVISNGTATLIDGSKRLQAHLLNSQYDALKVVDHTTLAVYVALKDLVGKVLSPADLNRVTTLQQDAKHVEKGLENFSFSPATHARQQELMQQAVAFMNTVVARSQISANELNTFVRRQTPKLMENANEAVAIELTNLDRQVRIWKNTVAPARWKMLHVVVCDEHMPRQNERYLQYFLKLFRENHEGQHVIYQEGNFDEGKAIQLLGTHLLDTDIAKAFFGNNTRMHRDLLFDGARLYLQQHKVRGYCD